LGYLNELNYYHQFLTDTQTMNHVAIAGLRLAAGNHALSLHGQYVAAGFNSGNYSAESNYRFGIGKNFYLSSVLHADQQMPAFMNIAYYSPHFIWSDTFSNILTQNAELAFGSWKYKFKLGAFVQQQQNQVYFDTLALPQQYNGTTSIIRLFAQKDLKLGPVHLNNTINYQTTQNTDIIRLPQYYTTHQLYYEAKLFKKALWLQTGFQARYISSFKANAYMPATNQFYLQNKQEYGNYVFVDFFINARIERFSFFLLAAHLNQGYSGANYMLCPNYAMPDRSFKAGLTWMFQSGTHLDVL
jgi:hypothetical protein